MTRIVYDVVQHDGGWAYRLGDVFSETFASEAEAHKAAERAAAEQQLGGEDETIEYQDASGTWREERSRGDDRPQAEVRDETSGKTG